MALIDLTANNPQGAIDSIERALAAKPNNASWHVLAARAYVGASDLLRADKAMQKAIKLNRGRDANVLCDAGYVCTVLQKHNEANRLFGEATRREPKMALAYFNLGMNERYLGMTDKAEKSLTRAIKLDSNLYEAMWARSDLRTASEDDNHIDQLEDCLARQVPPIGEAQLCFALARELEDLQRYDESFARRKRGADLLHNGMQYDVTGDTTTIDGIINTHTRDALAATNQGSEDSSPIFILGLPRTGTTLTERIVGSHSEVKSAGELRDFATELVRLCDGQQAKQDMVALTLKVDMQKLGENYVKAVRQTVSDAPHVIDKLPLNYLYCGLISRALPNAKIVHLKRDPMDACYAIYKALFKQVYPFSYNLDTLATYYIAYRKLIAHWENALGDYLLHVNYEDIVNDLEFEARRIIAFIGLDWQPDILNFHTRRDASTTASAMQVRSPVHRGSIGKWKNYAQQLEPLRARLDDAGVLVW